MKMIIETVKIVHKSMKKIIENQSKYFLNQWKGKCQPSK